MNLFVEVVINRNSPELDKLYTYKVEKEQEKAVRGMRVIVPFGNGNKNIEAYIVNVTDTISFDYKKCKSVVSFPDDEPIITNQLMDIALFMKDKYYCTLADCINTVKPKGATIENEQVIVTIGEAKLTAGEQEVYRYIKNNDNKVCLKELVDEFPKSAKRVVAQLQKKSVIEIKQVTEVKNLVQKIKYAYINIDNEENEEKIEMIIKQNNAQSKVLEFLRANDSVSVSDIKQFVGVSDSPINTLQKNGIIEVEKIEVLRNPITEYEDNVSVAPVYTEQQQSALEIIKKQRSSKDKKPVLLYGVTGSGKTEVYLNIVEDVIKEGKQVIVLVPEIALTGQVVNIFVKRFKELVTVTHSRLSIGERYDQYRRARDGRVSIVIGARSAIFAPFDNIGAIIIDEEHETTYKSDTTPKYSAIEVAIERARVNDSLVVLGSATPDINSYYKAQNGIYELAVMDKRVNDMLPNVSVVDMREELVEGNKSMFSRLLLEKIVQTINRGEQVILFINRRGFSNFVSCRTCGESVTCDNCAVSYTYHQYDNKLVCHYCGKTIKNPKLCPTCGSKYIKYFGVGTQKVEEEIKKLFPNENVIRMDMDTTSGKFSHDRLLQSFRRGEAKFLIGTQMIAKGLDFPNVTLVGVIAADLSLNNNEYRAEEVTFQLLTQVAGRAGRSEKQGDVIIQTYKPEHYSIQLSAKNDYVSFYENEIAHRRMTNNPPFSNIFVIMVKGGNEKNIIKLLFKLSDIMVIYNKENNYEILGPTPSSIFKIRNEYRWKLIVKGEDEQKLKNFVTYTINKLKEVENTKDYSINLYMNPNVIM